MMHDCGSGCTDWTGCILERDTKPRFEVISLLPILEKATLSPFLSSTSFNLSINTLISIYGINISATQLPAVALLRGLVGSTWQVNDNYYITLLKFRLIGIREPFSLISLPPAGAQMSVFHSKAQTACSTVTLILFLARDSGNSSHGSPQSIPTQPLQPT